MNLSRGKFKARAQSKIIDYLNVLDSRDKGGDMKTSMVSPDFM